MAPRKRFHLNVAGDFYVEAGCCLSCGVPAHIAPQLFTDHGLNHCYVHKQPETSDEMRLMSEVFATQDLGCVRYAGTDKATLLMLRSRNGAESCDHPGLVGRWRIFRDRVRWRLRRAAK
jgi:hypothetical protein